MKRRLAPEDRSESARLRLEVAHLLFENDKFSDSLTRAYFAVFHAAKAALQAHALEPRTHKGTHILLGLHFRDRLDTAFAQQLWEEREDCDYELYVPSEEVVRKRLAKATRFLERVDALPG